MLELVATMPSIPFAGGVLVTLDIGSRSVRLIPLPSHARDARSATFFYTPKVPAFPTSQEVLGMLIPYFVVRSSGVAETSVASCDWNSPLIFFHRASIFPACRLTATSFGRHRLGDHTVLEERPPVRGPSHNLRESLHSFLSFSPRTLNRPATIPT